jgi:Phosphoesterase family
VHVPSPRVIGAAVLLMLGFGIAIGTAAGPHANATLASATPQRRVVVVVQPPPAPATTTQATTMAESKPEPKPKAKSTPTPAASDEDSSEPAAATPTSTDEPKAKEKDDSSSDEEDAGGGSSEDDADKPPTIKHVWIVALTGHTMDEALADPSPMPYLSGTLRPKGLLLSKYKAVATGGLANLIALISGQKPTADQQAGCAAYNDVDPKTRVGCVFANDVDTLPGQLTAAGRTWRGYVEDSDAAQPPDTCKHPAAGGPLEPVMARDPFLFFHSIVDTPDCAANIAGLSRLAPDTEDAESAPTLALVIPNPCHNGQDQPCADGQPAGLGAADAWLKAQLDPLLSSKAYKDHGMVVVTFDAGTDPSKPVGALLISSAVKAGSTDDAAHDHDALLRTLEDFFSLDPLGEAKDAKAIEVTNASR